MSTAPAGYSAPRPRPPRRREEPIAPEPDSARPEPPLTAWWRPVALAASCLVIGFVLGWMAAGDDGPATVVPQGTDTEAVAPTETAPAGTTVTAEEEPPPPDPAAVAVAVLNGTGVTGLAARAAAEVSALGYADVSTGNAPTTSGPSTVYYRPGAEAAAARLAEEMAATGGTAALPASGELAGVVPGEAQLALVLGPG